jgi:patatin-like phospholipase/acyl hydrolase
MSYRILSFCGGGIRGLLSAKILQRLADKVPGLLKNTDLLAGTSTGADIISQILANKTPKQICKSYSGAAAKFFKKPKWDTTQPAYSVQELVAGQLLLHPRNPFLNELPRKVLFTAFNVGGPGQDWQPLLLHNLNNSEVLTTRLVDAVVSSSAMPGMFGSHNGNIDGAFVNHDPTLAAIAAAVSSGVDPNEIVAVCFGTGFMGNSIASDTSNWGAAQWQNGDGNPASNLPALLINGTQSPILNACLNGTSTNLIPQLSGMMLPNRYACLNATLDRVIPENDTCPEDLKYLERMADAVDLSAAIQVLKG